MQRVFRFEEGNSGMVDVLGGKGSNLSELTNLGMPVPKGVIVSTEACLEYLAQNHESLNDALLDELWSQLDQLQEQTGKRFNDAHHLLLVSVRSGAKISMPGMMDTILNIGLNDENVVKLAEITDNARFAHDSYRRLIQMYGNVVDNIPMSAFDQIFNRVKKEANCQYDYQLTVEQLQEIIEGYHQVYIEHTGDKFPQNIHYQINRAVEAVFKSWNNDRAKTYRRLNHIPHNLGTAVTIQEMVFGNLNDESGTGVLFTRNPANGKNELYGEYLLNAQGEDVVAGIRTPEPIAKLHQEHPDLYDELYNYVKQLEKHYKNMQDVEFTVENNRLYLLQTRNGKRTAKAACRVAVEMVEEGLLTSEEALLTVDANSISQLLHATFDPASLSQAIIITSSGLPASPGAATGAIVFNAEQAMEWAAEGHDVILVRHETSPEDIGGMSVAQAIVTTQGGMTSHAAVVARGMGKCCVTGCEQLSINEEEEVIHYPGGQLQLGDIISVNGETGTVYLGEIAQTLSQNNDDFDQIIEWAQQYARLEVRMNAETAQEIEQGLKFGATGIGLVRTEHMFFPDAQLAAIREFILATDEQGRLNSIGKILTHQQNDFEQIFNLIGTRPVVIRLLDLPLHEFLPKTENELKHVAEQQQVSVSELSKRVKGLSEVNPMLGHRGCRLAMTYPEIYLMQTEAIVRAAAAVNREIQPEIMIPLVTTATELVYLKEQIQDHLDRLIEQEGLEITYSIGTMIETPRACLIAESIAEESEFISFGTNDLTQMTFGFSRDDVSKFIHHYIEQGILEHDPFQQVDAVAVADLLSTAVNHARTVKPTIKLGVCGEHGGDPHSIAIFDAIGLTYVSCSPYRIPIAQLAAAQSAIRNQ